MTALLRADALTKRYGSTLALDHVSFEVPPGITGLLGANGAGKSTAIRLFLGLLQPDEGSAEFQGVSLGSSPDVRQRIGYMPEHDCLPDHVHAAGFLTYLAQLSGLPPAEARVRAADVLRHVGLDEERYRPLGTYSTGMKQRVKLAQALVHDPVLVMLDEPTAGLDPLGRHEMLDLVIRTGHDFGISILLSSHLMGDVERACERIVLLEAGRVLSEGAVSTFTEQTERLTVRLTEGHEAFVAELRRRGFEPVEADGAVVIAHAGDAEYDAIRDAVVASGALLYSMVPGRQSLTDLFRRPADGATP